MLKTHYILSLSCLDRLGIVAAVSNYLSDCRAFILESSQFGDVSTCMFFMRIVFEVPDQDCFDKLKNNFYKIAHRFEITYSFKNIEDKPNVLILVSKASHCLNDILYRQSTENLKINLKAIVSNHDLLRPMSLPYHVPFYHFPILGSDKTAQESQILDLIEKEKIDLVILARYMQIFSPQLCQKLYGKAINIHHSFLPSFKGARPYHQAFHRGVKIIGATAHYVTDDLDEGPIIVQETRPVNHSHCPSDLMEIGQDVENLVLSKAIKLHIQKKVFLNGHKTVIF